MLLLLNSLMAAPPPPSLPPYMYRSKVSTPFGVLDKGVAWGFCFSPHVVVFDIASTKTFLKEYLDSRGQPRTQLVFSSLEGPVVASLRGNSGETMEMFVNGGPLNGSWYETSPRMPQPVVGRRYVVAYHPLGAAPPNTVRNWPVGTPVLHASYEIGPAYPVSDWTAVAQQLEAECKAIDFTVP